MSQISFNILCDPAEIRKALLRDGLRPMTAEDLPAIGAMADALIGPGIAPGEVIDAVAERSQCSLFVHDRAGVLGGALAIIPVNPVGLAALEADRFDGTNPPIDGVARPGEPLAGIYGWGFVGVSLRATAAVVSGMHRLRVETYPRLPFFGRAATDAGRKVMEGRLGYGLQPGTASGLYHNLPSSLATARSAA